MKERMESGSNLSIVYLYIFPSRNLKQTNMVLKDFIKCHHLQYNVRLVAEPQLESPPRLLAVSLLVDRGDAGAAALLTGHGLERGGEARAERAARGEKHDEPVPGSSARGGLGQVLKRAVGQLLDTRLLHADQGLQHHLLVSWSCNYGIL